MKIRDFQPSDAQPVRDLALRCWRHAYVGIYSDDEIVATIQDFYSDAMNALTLNLRERGLAQYKILISESGPVGFQTSTISESLAELRRLYVDPSLIGQGYGTQLLETAEEYFQSKGCGSYLVKVHHANGTGIAFYERRGFQPIGHEDEEIIYKKILSPTGGPQA